MGNYITKSYDINNRELETGTQKKNKTNSQNRGSQQFGCHKIYKRRMKEKPEVMKSHSYMLPNDTCRNSMNGYSSGNYEILNVDSSANQESTDGCTLSLIKDVTHHQYGCLKDDQSPYQDHSPQNRQTHPRLSDTSLNSDDLMLSTDVNLDQADDDVSKDYNASEKDDPFISALTSTNQEKGKDGVVQICVEDSEKNDIVCFDSSRESSASLQRKLGYRVHSRRPHSFSTPLRSTEIKSKVRRSSNLNTLESVDLAWTWMSASESANIIQEVSNLKLMLLKTKRLLQDDFNNELLSTGSIFNENDPNVFSEPSTPVYYNDQQKPSTFDSGVQQPKDWSNMDKEALIQVLQDMSECNYSLNCQLNDKNRVIELLQDNKRRFLRPHSRTDPINTRISRSSTFDSSAMINYISATPDNSIIINTTLSDNGSVLKSEMKNIDSGLYHSSSSTDSCAYQN